MKSEATVRLEREIEKLGRTIDQDPDDEKLMALIEQMKTDHAKVRKALQYADLPEQDKRKLARLAESMATA